jgi:hypothetical protein
MNANLLAGYSYLWDGSEPGWVLLSVPDLLGGYCVFHKTNQVICLIESDDVKEAVCKKMLEEGCEILDDLPPMGEVTVLPM